MLATDIKWDIDLEDGETYEEALKKCCLPTEMMIPKDMTDHDAISDWLSDEFGFCHRGFILKNYRDIDITKENVNCTDDIYFEKDGINIIYELWFDVDEYFGTDTASDDLTWINFYTYWHPDKGIWASYTVDSDSDTTYHEWELTKEEKTFFMDKIEQYCKQLTGKTLKELWDRYQEIRK